MSGVGGIRHPLLEEIGVAHRFGLRDTTPPEGLVLPRQVHGSDVADLGPGDALDREEADGVVSARPDRPIGIVTADCVPVLIASAGGTRVAALHAGWRGLSAGVLQAGVDALQQLGARELRAVVGPCIGRCCYEVDEPVLAPLRRRLGAGEVAAAATETRPGHARIDLGRLSIVDLTRCGVEVGRVEGACTCCEPARFHSYRRDGERAGRMSHWIAARG